MIQQISNHLHHVRHISPSDSKVEANQAFRPHTVKHGILVSWGQEERQPTISIVNWEPADDAKTTYPRVMQVLKQSSGGHGSPRRAKQPCELRHIIVYNLTAGKGDWWRRTSSGEMRGNPLRCSNLEW